MMETTIQDIKDIDIYNLVEKCTNTRLNCTALLHANVFELSIHYITSYK